MSTIPVPKKPRLNTAEDTTAVYNIIPSLKDLLDTTEEPQDIFEPPHEVRSNNFDDGVPWKYVSHAPKVGDTVISVKSTLRYYVKPLTAALLKNAPHSVLTLTVKAHGSGLISGKVKCQLNSLDPNVPYYLMCRYLLVHVCKNIHSQYELMHWLELLSTVNVPSNLLSLMRQHYDSLVSMGEEDGDGKVVVFKEFEVPALTEILAGHSSKWEVIAISLGLPDNKIKNIAAKNVSKPVEVALNEVLLSWVRGEFEHAKPPTLRNLQEALHSNTVGLGSLANNVQLVNSQTVKHSTSLVGKFRIVDHTKHVVVTEGNHALLEVQISGNHEAAYLWAHSIFENVKPDVLETHHGSFLLDFRISTSGDCIICILASDISSEGYYQCKVTCTEGDKTPLYTKLMPFTVHTPIDQYTSFLADRYTRSPEIPSEWPPASTNSFINLALIKQEDIHKAGKYGRCTIRGDMDDIFKDKESITYDKALGGLISGACLLIEGRPGSGKTTLVHKFCRDWARKEITVTDVRLLFFIHLRGFCSDPNIGLSDLIGCYFGGSDVEIIEKYANKHHGLGLCFVLDGLDEYLPQRKHAYIYELIRKHVLPKSVVIVASRPAAAADFRSNATRQIEVLGFLRDQIYDYIEKYAFSCPSKSHTGLIEYLEDHPNVLHMCYLPIHTCMVCFLYNNLESDLPQTETSIYAEFTKFTMLRMLYRDDSNTDMYIESLTDLPEPQNQLYVSICTLAFEMTKSSKQVMRQTEVKHFSLQPSDVNCLGLITVDKMAMICGFQKLYTFLHLTFQEFLAAFYITSLDEEKQLELIEEYRNATQMKQVWKFYCGLVPFNATNSTVSRLIGQSCHGTSFKVQCSFESQQSCTCDSVADKNSLLYKDHFFTSSDFSAIAYVISNAQHQCVMKVVFDKCTIGMEGVENLAKKACGKLSLITTLCYHGYDCATEQLSVVNRLMHALPCLEILDVSNTNLGPAEVNALTGSLNHPNLLIVKVGSKGNPLFFPSGLPLQLTNNFSSGCSKLVNVCFSGNTSACLPESLPFPFYFYCDVPHINMCFKLRPVELRFLLDDLMYSHICIELYLAGCGIDDGTASILAEGLKQCTNLEVLNLSCNRIGDKGAVSLAESVKCCLRLNLSLNRIGDVGAMAVASATKCLVYLCGNSITNTNAILQHVSGLNVDFHTLTFSGCGIGDSGVESLSHFMEESSVKALCELSTKTTQCYSDVHVLDISSNNISYHGAIALCSCLKYFPHLEVLNISGNNIGSEGAMVLGDVLQYCKNLTGFYVSNNNIQCSGIRAISNSFQKMHKLDISGNNIRIEGAIILADALQSCKALNELDISDNNIGTEGAIILAEALQRYKNLSKFCMLGISDNKIGKEGAIALADVLQCCTNLSVLTVSNNGVWDSINALVGALQNCTHLEELTLNISVNTACTLASSIYYFKTSLQILDISNSCIGSEGCKAISEALKNCTNLKEFNFSGNFLMDGNAKIIAEALKFCVNLHKLNISYNNIGREGANAIADALYHCTHLKELNVSQNKIREEGACSIASSFSHYAQCLVKLDIRNNHIGNDGCKAIAKALKHCVNIRELCISSNNIGNDGAIALAEALRNCSYTITKLCKLDIVNNNFGREGAIALSESLKFCPNLHQSQLELLKLSESLKFKSTGVITINQGTKPAWEI